MGYYTRFELEIYSGHDRTTDYVEVVEEQVGHHPFGDETKWYDHEKDMKKLASFILTLYLSLVVKVKRLAICGRRILRMEKCRNARR